MEGNAPDFFPQCPPTESPPKGGPRNQEAPRGWRSGCPPLSPERGLLGLSANRTPGAPITSTRFVTPLPCECRQDSKRLTKALLECGFPTRTLPVLTNCLLVRREVITLSLPQYSEGVLDTGDPPPSGLSAPPARGLCPTPRGGRSLLQSQTRKHLDKGKFVS